MSKNPYKDLNDVNDIDLSEYQVKVRTEKGQIKSFQFNVLTLLEAIIFQPGLNFSYNCNFFNSVNRVENSTSDENLHIISP